MKIDYVIADLHFGHENLVSKEDGRTQFDSIQEHDDFIVDNWNSVVRDKDRVFVLGDVCFGRVRNDSFSNLSRLNGEKVLIMGNHDVYDIEHYVPHFSKILSCYSYEGGILSHIPIHPNQLEKRFKFNIHGHLHHKTLDDVRYKCVSCEQINFTPVILSDIIHNILTLIGE